MSRSLSSRSPTVLFFLGVSFANPAHAAWPQTWTIFVDSAGMRDVQTVSHIVDGGDYFFVGEFHDAFSRELYVRRVDSLGVFSNRASISTGLSLSGEAYLPSAATYAGSPTLNVSAKVTSTCGTPTSWLEELRVSRSTLNVLTNNPIDLANPCVTHKHSFLLSNPAATKFTATWTLDVNSDDVWVHDRLVTALGVWGNSGTDVPKAVATDAAVEQHGTFAFRSDGKSVLMYHDASGVDMIAARFVTSTGQVNTTLPGTGGSDWPHLIEHNGTLHLVVQTAPNKIRYTSCTGDNDYCSDTAALPARWTTGMLISDGGEVAKHPQIVADSNGNLVVAYDVGTPGNVLVKQVSRCGAAAAWGGWALVDAGAGEEGLGGFDILKVYPAMSVDTFTAPEQVSISYVRDDAGLLRGRWARKNATGVGGICP